MEKRSATRGHSGDRSPFGGSWQLDNPMRGEPGPGKTVTLLKKYIFSVKEEIKLMRGGIGGFTVINLTKEEKERNKGEK